MVLIKRGVSLNQASYQLWVDNGKNNCHAGKNQSYCCNCYCRGALTPQPDGNLQKKTRTTSFRLRAKPMSLRLSNTILFLIFDICWWFKDWNSKCWIYINQLESLDDFRKRSYENISFCHENFVVVLKGHKEIVKPSFQECLDKKGKNYPSNSDSYENLSVCDQTCPS